MLLRFPERPHRLRGVPGIHFDTGKPCFVSHQAGSFMALAIAVGTICHGVSTSSQTVSNVSPALCVSGDFSQKPSLPVESIQDASLTVVVPAHTILMLGSMDFSAQRHVLKVSVKPADELECCSERQEIVGHVNWNNIRDGRRQDSDQFAFQSTTIAIPVNYTQQTSGVSSRRFEVPYFSEASVGNRYVIASEVFRGRSVCVFSDNESQWSRNIARQIVTTMEAELRDFVERQVGLIADIDGDGQLTVMLTPLTDDSHQLGSGSPIYGCVRGSDYLQPDGDFAGDIIYLDPAIVERQIDAILAHELAHAATFSAMRDHLRNSATSSRMPCWLNEAIAHFVERRVCPDSENMRQRLLSFHKQPHLYPVVIPDDSTSSDLKRGPARAAGCLFLEAVLNRFDAKDAVTLITHAGGNCGGLESVTGHKLEELLRHWGPEIIRQHSEIPTCDIKFHQSATMDVCGTAFRWIAAASEPRTVMISTDDACRLQVTMIHLDQ
jgi:hypothetical protein